MLDDTTLMGRILLVLYDHNIELSRPANISLAKKLWVIAREFDARTQRTPYNLKKFREFYQSQAHSYFTRELKKAGIFPKPNRRNHV